MDKVVIYHNQDYTDQPEKFTKQRKILEDLKTEITRNSDRQVSMRGLNFSPGPVRNMDEHITEQLVTQIRDLIEAKIIAFFGDGGSGLFLGAIDQIARIYKERRGRELSGLRENPICLAPGGTYVHGAKAMGTSRLSDVVAFARGGLNYRRQLVHMRNCRVTKRIKARPEYGTYERNHPFYAFAGMFFDAYLLELNERLSRNNGHFQNEFRVFVKIMKEVFLGDILDDKEGGLGRRRSKLRAITTIPSWGMVKFGPEVESLGDDGMYLMQSDEVGPLGLLKIATIINMVAANRRILQKFFQHVDEKKKAGAKFKPVGIQDVMHKFRPRRVAGFSEDFDPSLLGGLHYSTDGFPHTVSLSPGEEARLDISTIPDSGVHVVRHEAT